MLAGANLQPFVIEKSTFKQMNIKSAPPPRRAKMIQCVIEPNDSLAQPRTDTESCRKQAGV